MKSFEEFEIAPVLVEAFAAEGIEFATPVQEESIPVLLRGNHVVLAAGPGSGAFAAWASALLSRIEPGSDGPSALVVVPLTDIGEALAESMARLGISTGHSVAVLGRPWALPDRADVVFGTPSDIISTVKEGRLSVEEVGAVVVEAANILAARGESETLSELFEMISSEAQRILVALPVTAEVEEMSRKHLSRGVQIPAQTVGPGDGPVGTERGTVGYRIVGENKESALVSSVAALLEEGDVRHVLIYTRSEDRAADFGDYLALHGFMAGRPGDGGVPVWLAVDALATRKELDGIKDLNAIATLSVDAPADEDTFDRRHGIGRPAIVMALPRELHHLRSVAGAAGYRLDSLEQPRSSVEDPLAALRRRLSDATKGDLSPYAAVLTPLLDAYSGYELAAAALSLLAESGAGGGSGRRATSPASAHAPQVDGMKRLFVSLGTKDNLRPGDVLGALSGESGVPGEHFGRIDIKETFSIVEVRTDSAPRVIKAVNGRTIRGRSVRVDYDRAGPPRDKGGPSRDGRHGSGSRSR